MAAVHTANDREVHQPFGRRHSSPMTLTRQEEWDFPPRRRRGFVRVYRTLDVARPTGRNALATRALRAYCRALMLCIKALVSLVLGVLAAGAFGFAGLVILSLFKSL
jgi:hypothetical protein